MQEQATSGKRRVRVKSHTGIYRSVSGSYEIAYRDSDGRLRFETQPKGTSLEEAKAARANVVSKLGKGERVAPSKEKFGDWAEEWLEGLDVRPRTIEAYRYALDKHLLPRFKNRKLAEITTENVARLVTEMRRDGKAEWTISGTLSTLSGCLGRAKRRGMLAANPVRELERKERARVGNGEKRALTQAEISSVLSEATETFKPLISVMIFGGLRVGETLALKWRDIDFEHGFIHVRHQLGRDRQPAELKTDRGRRDVILIPDLAKVLREHRMRSLHKQAGDFLFPAPEGRGRDQRSTARAVERTLKRAGLDQQRLSSHTFRHTFASLLIVGLKLDPVSVAAQLGHSNPATTLRFYAHLFEQAKHADEARDALSAGFGHLLAGTS
jgi:integrase